MRFFNGRDTSDRVGGGISRTTIEKIDDSKFFQQHTVNGLSGEKQQSIEHVHPYGFSTHPKAPSGGMRAEGFLTYLGGMRSHGVNLMTGDRRYRFNSMQEGEVALHDDQGHQMHIARDGMYSSAPNSKKIIAQIMQDDIIPGQRGLNSGSGGGSNGGGGGGGGGSSGAAGSGASGQQFGQTAQKDQKPYASYSMDKNSFVVNHPKLSQIISKQNQVVLQDKKTGIEVNTDNKVYLGQVSGQGSFLPVMLIDGSPAKNTLACKSGGGGGGAAVSVETEVESFDEINIIVLMRREIEELRSRVLRLEEQNG